MDFLKGGFMPFDKKKEELVQEAVDCAEHIMDDGYSRDVAILTAVEKFGIPKETLERKVSKRNTERNDKPITPKERYIPKANGMGKVLVTK